MTGADAHTLARRDRRFGYLLTAPRLAALMLVITFLLIFALFTSFYDYTLLNPRHDDFIGGENYQEFSQRARCADAQGTIHRQKIFYI